MTSIHIQTANFLFLLQNSKRREIVTKISLDGITTARTTIIHTPLLSKFIGSIWNVNIIADPIEVEANSSRENQHFMIWPNNVSQPNATGKRVMIPPSGSNQPFATENHGMIRPSSSNQPKNSQSMIFYDTENTNLSLTAKTRYSPTCQPYKCSHQSWRDLF